MKTKICDKCLLFVIPIILLSSCSQMSKTNRLKQEYGSIQLLLDHSKDYSRNWINSNEYTNTIKNEKCFDTTGEIYNLLYNLEYKKVSDRSVQFYSQSDIYIRYSIPFDDYAGIYLRDDGYGRIDVGPDLSIGLSIKFKANIETTNEIFEVANVLLADFINK